MHLLVLVPVMGILAALPSTALPFQEKPAPLKITYSAKVKLYAFVTESDGIATHVFHFDDNIGLRLPVPSEEARAFLAPHQKACYAERDKAGDRVKELSALFKKAKNKDEQKKIAGEMLEKASEVEAWGQHALQPEVVVEGTVDGESKLSGKIRLHEAKGKDKDLPLGTVILEGELLRRKFAPAKGVEATLGLRNGDAPIAVVGKSDLPADARGLIRVTGKLRREEKSKSIYVEADKVETVKR